MLMTSVPSQSNPQNLTVANGTALRTWVAKQQVMLFHDLIIRLKFRRENEVKSFESDFRP